MTGTISASKKPRCCAATRLRLRGERHAVLRLALDAELGGDVLGRLGHRVDAVQLLHPPVDEAPADRRVVDRVGAAERRLGLGHHERRAAHALDAAGDHQLRLAALDRARRACPPRPCPSRTGG